MLHNSKIEFKNDHFLIDDETRVEIVTKEQMDKRSKKQNYFEDHNYVHLGDYITKDGKKYVFLTLGVSR